MYSLILLFIYPQNKWNVLSFLGNKLVYAAYEDECDLVPNYTEFITDYGYVVI